MKDFIFKAAAMCQKVFTRDYLSPTAALDTECVLTSLSSSFDDDTPATWCCFAPESTQGPAVSALWGAHCGT